MAVVVAAHQQQMIEVEEMKVKGGAKLRDDKYK